MATTEDVNTILDGRRSFILRQENGDQVVYYIADPTAEDVRKADWQYAKIYNKAISDDFLTQSQMYEVLKKKGVLSDEFVSELEGARISLAAELYKLENLSELTSDDDKEAIAITAAKLREEVFRLNQKINSPMGNTCENLAEDARIEYLTSRLIQKQDGTKLWKTFEDYQQENSVALQIKSRFEVMLALQGLSSDFLEKSPEQIVLRDLAQKRLDQALSNLQQAKTKKEESSVVESVPAVEELTLPDDAVPKKRRGRRPATSKS